ncbi:molybdopterin-dependent oxidoreductase [Kitasatospora sp. NPDC056327]|uniref:molybdopterin-dependent oxidoreductase n=1 Tax=Kitasatospora sp. NPDC056327 TaxID=3345785 RepID=UPI0035DD643D
MQATPSGPGTPADPDVPDTFLTPVDRLFVRSHLGPPRIDPAAWTLTVEGLVERPLWLDLAGLRGLERTGLTAFHECFGHPDHPDLPTRAVANLEWSGVALATVLALAGPRPQARHVWFEGADRGSFAGEHGLTYLKDLPLEQARTEVLLADTVNGAPLPPRHGFPLRAVAPRLFATNSVKWLTRLVLADHRPEHLFTTRLYTRVPPGGGAPRPAREVDVNSRLLAPLDGEPLPAGRYEVTGRAWGAEPVVAVEVAVDDGGWRPAVLDPRGARPVWQRFALAVPLSPGRHRIRCRATDVRGRVQPPSGARNAVHTIGVTVA